MASLSESQCSDDALTNRRRVRHSKVKTGCITCRIRRVKCDEAKPKCLRCHKYGAECGGYPPQRSKKSVDHIKTLRQNRILVPKTQYGDRYLRMPTISLYEGELERNYFNIFINQIAKDIFPYFNCDDWSQIIGQACVNHPGIRHTAIAIGALGKTYEIARSSNSAKTGERNVMNIEKVLGSAVRLQETSSEKFEIQAYAHHRQALEHYDKAIRCMRKDVEYGNQDIRTSLIICMVIICFEAIHGNYKGAAAQLQTGLAMIQDFQSQAQRKERHPQGFSSPCPDIVEDFLVQSFGRMEIQSMSVFDPRPVEIHHMLKNEGKEVIAAMPNPLQTIEQARKYLDLVTRRVMHFNGCIHVPRATPTGSASMSSTRPILLLLPTKNNGDHNPIPWIELKVPSSRAQSTHSSQQLQREKNDLLAELVAWTDASNEILLSAIKGNHQDAISALTLRIAAMSTKISLLSAFFTNESAYDTLFPQFRQIVQYASQIFDLQNHKEFLIRDSLPCGSTPKLNFSFELALIPALYTVVIKCRHKPTRHKALALLRSYPHREGVWDSVACSGLGAWVIALEEEGARQFNLVTHAIMSPSPSILSSNLSTSSPTNQSSNSSSPASPSHITFNSYYNIRSNNQQINTLNYSDIPEEVRVRKAKMRFDLLKRTANLFCLQMDISTEKYVEKTGTFKW
ncbi:putative zn2 cys6 dna-binding protein [Golovinomyces cichoracearum]|uniref:Putative zn2 cys6 dna-binding protein n=1 Tax=Golovinomyces cichoracearum TaxID=62708 RepID=A0A420GYX9_9PEZI|nr:putative zn2 cys6 dna-binding protein [Golovinomyces cichoracearum]